MGISRRRLLAGAGIGAAGVAAAVLIGPGSEVAKGRSRARVIKTIAKPPASADVVIIGGGNIGTAAALFLAEAGLSVVLCEKGAVAGEASGRSVGHVFSLGMEPDQLAITNLAKQIWPQVNALTGQESGFRQNGLLMQIAGEEDRHFWEHWIKDAGSLSPGARLLDGREAAKLAATEPSWFGAIYDPTDGSAEPPLVAPALALGAVARGATIVAPCAVRTVETEGGAVSGVVTEHGPIRTRNVVLAGGAWSTAFLQNLGYRLPVGNLFSWCASFYGVEGPATNGIFENTTWRRQIDGGFTTSLMEASAPVTPQSFRYLREMLSAMEVANAGWKVRPRLGAYFFEELMAPGSWRADEVSPFEKRRILEPEINMRIVERALTKMRANVPAFRNLKVGSAWGGVLSSTADTKPVLSPISKVPGLVIATGFSEGLTMAPAAGKLVAELVLGVKPSIDLRKFAYERFA